MAGLMLFTLCVILVLNCKAEISQKGVCWGHGKTAYYNGYWNYSTPEAKESLSNVAKIGANWIQMESSWYQDQCASTSIASTNYTPTDASMKDAISYAYGLGIQTMLNLHLELSCNYHNNCSAGCHSRTGIDFGDDKKAWSAWFLSYSGFILHYAKLCEAADGCASLTVMVELQQIPVPKGYWAQLISEVRKVFSGTLTASCNAGHGGSDLEQVDYWELLDFIGIDTFPSLGSAETVAVADVKDYFTKLLASYKPYVTKYDKKIVFTQIGYPSVIHCGSKSAEWHYKTPDEQCQCNAYEGMLQAFSSDSSVVAGLYWWNVLPCAKHSKDCQIGPKDWHESPQQKGAMDVLAAWYGGSSHVGTCTNQTGAPMTSEYLELVKEGLPIDTLDGSLIYEAELPIDTMDSFL